MHADFPLHALNLKSLTKSDHQPNSKNNKTTRVAREVLQLIRLCIHLTKLVSPPSFAKMVDVPKSQKAFIPLENNPAVMTSMLRNLGLSPALSFHDIYSLSDPDLLAFVPRPCYALLLVFPVSPTYEKARMAEDKDKEDYAGKGAGEEVLWFKQTIRNACGLMGLLHGVSNGPARDHIQPDSPLAKFLAEATPLAPEPRSQLLYDSPAFESAHHAAASGGQSAVPNAEDEVELHYVAFVVVSKDGAKTLFELDGRRKGPLNRGSLGEGDDVLSEKALELGPRRFMRVEEEGGGDIRFSLVGLGPSEED